VVVVAVARGCRRRLEGCGSPSVAALGLAEAKKRLGSGYHVSGDGLL
jgi:hypothetical protein